MHFERQLSLKTGLRFGASSLTEFDCRVRDLFPAKCVTLEIEVRYERQSGRFESVEALLSTSGLPDMIYDVRMVWSKPADNAAESSHYISLRRYAAVEFFIKGPNDVWLLGASQSLLEIAARYAYTNRILEPKGAPLSVVVYSRGLPGAPERFVPSSSLKVASSVSETTQVQVDTNYDYDVAISYAGSDREVAREIARCLRGRGFRVFYDEFAEAQLAGANLQNMFVDIYRTKSRYAIAFVSKAYSERKWPALEAQAILSRAMEDTRNVYFIPIRIDGSNLDGLLPTIGYLDLRQNTPAKICAILCEKFGMASLTKDSTVAAPYSAELSGIVQFDYSSYSGRYEIGMGPHSFETQWSKAGDSSIHCNDSPATIKGVALAPRGSKIEDIMDARTLDFTSHNRTPEVGRVVVLKNMNDFFAAVQIIDVKDDSRGAERDELTFAYRILADGEADFSQLF